VSWNRSNFWKRTSKSVAAAFRLIWRTLYWPVWASGKSVSFLGSFIAEWWKSRNLKPLLWGLPAFLVGMSCLVFGGMVGARDRYSLARQYVASGRDASKRSDWASAKLLFERSLELGVRDPETLFELAVVAEKSGDESRKLAVMERLAPDKVAVYAPAHFWRATQILSRGDISKPDAAEAEAQLKLVLQLDSENINAHSILGDLYFQAGLWQSAIEHLQYSRPESFKYRLLLAKASAAAGNVTAGRNYAEQVLTRSKEIVAVDPTKVEARLVLGEAALLLEQYEEAVTVLEEGLRLSDRPEFHQALGLVLMHWSDSLPAASDENRLQAFQLLAKALEQNPNELLLFDRLLALLRREDEVAGSAEAFLLDNIVQGRSLGMSHLILGTASFEKGDIVRAGKHLEQAFRIMPNGLVVANNYAWFLIKSEAPDPVQAMKIINAVIQQDQKRPEFRDTRGHIFLAMGEWKSALADFEWALPQLPASIDTHEGLSLAYERLGFPELAEKHSKMSKQVREEQQKRLMEQRSF
jgi:tetratricopeptide (TPR) repeat protein